MIIFYYDSYLFLVWNSFIAYYYVKLTSIPSVSSSSTSIGLQWGSNTCSQSSPIGVTEPAGDCSSSTCSTTCTASLACTTEIEIKFRCSHQGYTTKKAKRQLIWIKQFDKLSSIQCCLDPRIINYIFKAKLFKNYEIILTVDENIDTNQSYC